MKYQAVRGARDLFGEDIKMFDRLEHLSQKILLSYAYEEIRTPIFEKVEVFNRSLGKGTDIVSKEMYAFKDRGNRELALRPEGTAPIVRAVIEKNLIKKDKVNRFFYKGAMFRYDRPQAGRYRQFYQVGAEIFGVHDPWLDMEIIEVAVKILQVVALEKFKLYINSLGCLECREKYIKVLCDYLISRSKELCPVCQNRINVNVLRVFDCKNKDCIKLLSEAPKILDYICQNCTKDFTLLKDYLDERGIEYIVDRALVRGLDYYTGSVFEIKTDMLGAQDALAAGGRYDSLVKELGGNDIPAVGFALGEDRIIEVLKKNNVSYKYQPKITLIAVEKNAKNEILQNMKYIDKLREKGYIVNYDISNRSVKSQMRMAHDKKSDFVVFLEGNDRFSLKNMETGKQEQIHGIELLKTLGAGI
ncbi:histidine--tRNA ligase [bacterium]